MRALLVGKSLPKAEEKTEMDYRYFSYSPRDVDARRE